ncbi:hypothetical protein M3148_10745 [Georgenia satyanarayanai]|uniref:hypothetical protein n=1 Tax=Georgenia satyanarayanai TaxID=860221 RepID=UPI00203A6C34|nr:hypothetical protein [Georgenia satyanarayanai]MCM3661460.1 hypothetical protein [Georgenia satyanarayanai]
MGAADATAHEFFAAYTRALLSRHPVAIAGYYAVPALIEFPDQAISVSDAAQTEQFFAAAVGQYDGITDARADVRVVAEAGHSVWADVTWSYEGTPAERNMYQLVRTGADWRIAVLTPLDA